MPDSSGHMQLQDFDQELIDQGFDAIAPARRTRWINFAYNRICSEFPWYWEQNTVDVTLTPPAYSIDLNDQNVIPDFRSVDYVYVATAGQQRRLHEMDKDFYNEQYVALDQSAVQNRGEPSQYMVDGHSLYIYQAPQAERIIRIKYHRRYPYMAAAIDVPATPKYLDDAIVIASLSVAHKRTHELQLAAQMEADLGDWMDQMKIDEEWRDDQKLERTSPDDTWL